MDITNAELKIFKKLKDKKYRKENNLFLVEGIKACEELLNAKFPIKYSLSSNKSNNFFPNFKFVDYDVLELISTTKTPQDIVCVCEIPKKQDALPKGNSLILDCLQDPGNIGTLIRSAVAFGFEDIYFVNTADIYSEKVIRGSMGAIFKINTHIVDKDYIINNKRQICDILVGTDLCSDKISRIDKGVKVAVIIGNEGNGVSEELLKSSDKLVTLEMSSKVESLNAGVAGSILMYEIFKGV